MSRQLKLSIVVGVALSLLFCCSGLVGRLSQGPLRLQLNLQAPSVAWLRSRMTEKLHGKDLQLRAGAEASCAIQGERLLIPIGTSCEFAITASANRTRQLALALPADGSGGDAVAIRLDQELDEQNPMSVEETLHRDGDPLTLDVYRSRAQGEARLILQDCALGKDFKLPGEGVTVGCTVMIEK